MATTLGSLIVDSWRVTKWRLPILALLTFAGALLEGATIAALLPLLSSLGGTASSTARASSVFDNVFARAGLSVTPITVGALIASLVIASAVVFLVQSYLASRLQAVYTASWQRRMLSAFLDADYAFFLERRTGDLTAAITSEPSRIGLVFSQVVLILAASLLILVQVTIALSIAPAVVLIILVFGAMLFVATRPFAHRALGFGKDLSRVNADLMADAGEIISGAKFIKATATEGRALNRLMVAVDRLERLSHGCAFDGQIVKAIFEYSGGFLIVALLVAGPTFFSVDLGAILVVIAVFVRLFPRITGLRQSLQIVDFHMPAFVVAQLLVDSAINRREEIPNGAVAGPSIPLPAAISFDSVSVMVGSRIILDAVSLDIPAGIFAVLIGQTGAGKTTLLDCIIGLRRPSRGVVKVDECPLDAISVLDWRRGIGYLGQDPVLFNASIRENLRWTRPETTDEEMRAALSMAAAEFVNRLPLGLDTLVGEHGSKLSGGERQRIALARALLGAPRILILDEATSALDAETEEMVTAALSKLKGRLTIVAISHRRALLRAADLVFELADGKATSVGLVDRRPVVGTKN